MEQNKNYDNTITVTKHPQKLRFPRPRLPGNWVTEQDVKERYFTLNISLIFSICS